MPTFTQFVTVLKILISWPAATVAITLIVVFNLRRIATAFKRLPVIRKLKIYGIEFEIDEGEYREIKRVTDETFKRLIEDSDSELQKFSKICGLYGALEAVAKQIFHSRPDGSADTKKARFRATLHIFDPIFADQLYQIEEYAIQSLGTRLRRGSGDAGRRFSIRYGIIGLAARSQESQATALAFQGDDDGAKESLIREWSMLPEQAESASRKPACLAIAIKEPNTSQILGILYADAEVPNFFGTEDSCEDFARSCESFETMNLLASKLQEFQKLAVQLSVGFDLVRIGQK